VRCRSFHQSARSLAEALRDEAIEARYVRIVDAETGSLSPQVERVQTLLRKMDRTRYWLVQVKGGKLDQEAKEEVASSQASSSKTPWQQPRLDEKRKAERHREMLESEMPLEDLAIVKLIDKKAAYNKLKEKKMEKKQTGQKIGNVSGSSARKEVDLTWNATEHDVEHKLKTLLTHFRKKGPGAKGTVDIKAKPGRGAGGGVSAEHKNEMIRKMEEILCSWENGSSDEEEQPSAELACHARRQGDVEWRAGGTHATIRIEVVKGRKPKASAKEQSNHL
jgi:hypothetical protein